jgi:hypothetical protein
MQRQYEGKRSTKLMNLWQKQKKRKRKEKEKMTIQCLDAMVGEKQVTLDVIG